MPDLKTCDFCGGNADSGCGATSDGKRHYSKIDCAEILLRERDLLRDAIDKSNEALTEAVKTQEERDKLALQVEGLKKALLRVLDGCFCDDVGQLPECGRCVEVRAALDQVAEKRQPEKTKATGKCFVDHKGGDCPKCF